MKNIRTIIRTIILLALFFAPLSSAEPAAASVGNEHLTTQSASFAALPADLQTVVAETLQREGVMTAANDYDQQGKLLASGASGDNFGFSVAVDSTGTTALIGAYGVNGEQGAAYVFTCDNYIWTLEAMLIADDGAAGDRLGISVALSDNGSIAFVGAYTADVDGKADQGAVYIFRISSGVWGQVDKRTADDGAAGDKLGWSIAASGDGTTLIASAHNAEINGISGQGAAYVFRQSGPGEWSQQGKLTLDSAASNAYIGYSVSLSQDGNTALVGAFAYDYMGHNEAGAAISFTRSGSTWTYEEIFGIDDGEIGDHFGRAVSLSDDGNSAVIGANGVDVDTKADQGLAYIFTRSSGAWTEQATLQADDGAADDKFGVSVHMMGNGYVAYVGSNLADVDGDVDQGAVYSFAGSGASWQQASKLIASSGYGGDEFGVSIALGGTTLLVGARGRFVDGGSDQGSAFAFMPEGTGTREIEIAGFSANDDNFGISVALSNSGDTAVVGAYKADIGENTDQGALYVFKRADGVWENHYKLVADDGAANDKLGWSVAISGDGNTILTGAHAADVDGKIDQGAGYVFHYVYLLGWVDEKLTFNSPKEDISLGYSVALSDDGDTALLGAPTWPSPDGTDGMVTSFTRSGANTWTSEDFFWPSNAEPDQWFGRSVALSADGNTAIVGASKDDVGDNVDQGSAYILTHSSGFWSQVVNLTASDGLTGDEFGVSVAISGDGNTALVGAYLADVSGDADQGRAYLFNCPSGGAWQKVIGWTSNEAGDNFGVSVALSDDGATALVGARSDDVGDNVDQGAAYLYRADNGVWGPYGFITLTASDGTANDKFGFSVALSEDGSTALVGAYNASLGGISQGAAYPFGQQSDFTLYIPFVVR